VQHRRSAAQGGHLLDVLDAASPAELDRPPRVANPYFHTLGQGIAALRKALGKPRIG
jgi:hypothetical protein